MHTTRPMSGAELAAVLQATLHDYEQPAREAVRLLIEYDGHRWLDDEMFVELAVREDADHGRPQISIPQLGYILTEIRLRANWTNTYGPAAREVLWLACELAIGRIANLASKADPDTDPLIRSAIGEVFSRGASLVVAGKASE